MSKRGLMLGVLTCGVVSVAQAEPAGATKGAAASTKGAAAPTKAAAADTRTLPGGAVLRFSSDAKYELGKPIKLQLAPTGSDKTPVQVIKLSAGRVSITIPESKHPKTAVLIQAPRKVSAVAKGGESVVITAPDRITLAAVKGEMLAALGNDWKPLASGLVRSFGGGQATEHPVPQTPQLSVAQTLLLALRGKATTNVKAAPSSNVDHRDFWLYRVEGSGKRALVESEWRSESQQLPELTPGRYEVQARAVDRFGVQSPVSSPVTLRVVGAVLPEGARLVGETILLGRSSRVKLIGVAGLESSYGRASVFMPVPPDVGLARGASTLLRLREQGTKQELAIKLEPRTLKANIAIGPKTARWPGDALQVSVKLFDHRGKPVSDPLKTKPRVFVNVDQVVPTWSHSGNTYTAKVPPAHGAGPWVVRVEVNDDFGDEAGRDFIELGGTSATASR